MQQFCAEVVAALVLLNLIIVLTYVSIQYGPQDPAYGRRWQNYTPVFFTNSILDTCPLKVIDPFSPELLRFHKPNYNPKRGCRMYKPLTVLNKGRVEMVSNGTSCRARCLYPHKDYDPIDGEFYELPTNETFKCDAVETLCTRSSYHLQNESYLHLQIYENRTDNDKNSSLPNVYIILIDSTSTFMVKRIVRTPINMEDQREDRKKIVENMIPQSMLRGSLPKTLEFLKRRLGAVQMEFLNKVGDNSRPNGLPLYFGKSVEKIGRVGRPPEDPDWNNTEICNNWMDQYPYILEEYKKKGYKTFSAVDFSPGVIYYQQCQGLERKEADHLYKSFDERIAELRSTLLGKTCGERHVHMLRFFEMFMNAYTGIPKMATLWMAALSHQGVEALYHTDDQFFEMFKRNENFFDNSLLFFLGDHGPRYSDIHTVRLGRYENRNPFLLVALPKTMRNTAVHEELKAKSMQLMTHFDLHATLVDFLHYQPNSNFLDTRKQSMLPHSKGSSLFRKWEGPRNCQTLPIPSEYCLCQYEKKNVTDKELQRKLGTFVAEELNRELESTGYGRKCLKQSYKEAIDIEELHLGTSTLYTVYVQLQPSQGLFSAQVLSTPEGLQLSSGFTRWGMYGTMGDCVLDPPRSLCHCKGKTYENSFNY